MNLTPEERNFIIQVFQSVTIKGTYAETKQMHAMIERIHEKLTAVEQVENGQVEQPELETA